MRSPRRLTVSLAVLFAVAGAVRADGPEEVRAKRLRDQLPAVDMTKLDEVVAKGVKGGDAELGAAAETVAKVRERILSKWRTVGRLNLANAYSGYSPHFKAAENAMAVWAKEQDRRARLEEIDRRQAEEWMKRFGEKPDPSRRGPEMAALNRKYAEERTAVQAQFRKDMEAAKTGAMGADATAADRVWDELRAETLVEMTALRRATRTIERESARRKGVADDEDRKEREDDDRSRFGLRVVPYHTQYEAKTGETVQTIFQVFKGAVPYTILAVAPGTVEGPQSSDLAAPGDLVVPFTFKEAGEYTATVHVHDAQGADKAVSVAIRVTGAPWKPEPVDDADKRRGPPPPPPATTGGASAPVPQKIEGTFQATLWHCNAELPRVDESGRKDWLHVTGVPATVTIDSAGHVTSKVRYELPQADMFPDAGPVPLKNRFWRVSFDLDGTVDWASGKVTLEVTNGHDERGYEKDEPKTDDHGKQVGFIGHWRDRIAVDYSASLEGWTVPGPDAQGWVERVAKIPDAAKGLAQMDLETLGLPHVDVRPDGTMTLRDGGFFGAADFGARAPGATPHRRFRVAKHLWHSGYDRLNERSEDETAARRASHAADERSGGGSWYMKITGAAPVPTGPAPEPKKGDLLGFGLWPTRPISMGVGGVARTKAVGVFGDDVNQPVDLTAKSTWTASPGLMQVAPGEFTASAPGTYTITVTHPGTSGGPMSSTITVVVK